MNAPNKKKLIEVALPLEAINAASEAEKSNPFLKGHPRSLHQWWARRPIPAARAVIFAQLVDDPTSHPEKFSTEEAVLAERKRLFEIISDLVKWENMTNRQVLDKALAEIRKSNDHLPAVYDPFSGGCIIPSEAQRLGLEAIASDINPVAVAIGKSMIEIPHRFCGARPVSPQQSLAQSINYSDGLIQDVKHYARLVRDRALSQVHEYYPCVTEGNEQDVLAWIWARTVPSPDPAFRNQHVPIASTFVLAKKKGREAWIKAIPDKASGTVSFEVKHGAIPESAKSGTKSSGANFICALSGAAITAKYIREQSQSGKLGIKMMAIVARVNGKKTYLSPSRSQEEASLKVPVDDAVSLRFDKEALGFRVGNYGMEDFGSLFTARQNLSLKALSESIVEVRKEVEKDAIRELSNSDERPLDQGGSGYKAYSQAIAVYLQFAIDKLSGYSNSLCIWNNTNENVSNLFGRQTIQMTWDFAEANPYGPLLGFEKVADAVANSLVNIRPDAPGRQFQAAAQHADPKVGSVVISTDPPYYDNVGYADLSDFFYMWMRPALKDIFPAEFGTLGTPKSDELVASPHRYGGKGGAETFFLEGMTEALKNIHRIDTGEYPAAIYYAFKQSEIEAEGLLSTGWAAFLEAVFAAGYYITSTWPVRTERAARLRAHSSNALGSSVVLVCRKRAEDAEIATRAEFLRELGSELRVSVRNLQLANVPPADMPQSAIGPGMGVYSRYRAVLEADDSQMTVKTALQLINAELDEFLNDLHGEFDPETRFAATWFEQHGTDKSDFGAADSLARARGISVESVHHAGIVDRSAGKVRILKRTELDTDWDPASDDHLTIWECCQHLIRVLENDGEYAAAVLLKKLGPDRAEMVKDLAYYLYDVCSNKRQDAKEATSYNGLIAVWTELTRQAATVRLDDLNRQSTLDI